MRCPWDGVTCEVCAGRCRLDMAYELQTGDPHPQEAKQMREQQGEAAA